MALILKNAHVVDPSVELDGVVDVLIEGDKIARVAENIEVEGAEVRDLLESGRIRQALMAAPLWRYAAEYGL